MKNFEGLKQNLESYLRKYYTLRMLRGLALFLALFFSYILLMIFTEYFLYMSENQRKIVFFSGIGLGLFGVSYYFLFPLLQILKLAKRRSHQEVARMIGKNLKGIDDKILNTLQLGDALSNQQSDLITAAIEQKSSELSLYSFKDSLSWKSLSRVALFLSLPVSLIVILSFSTQGRLVLGSSERLLRYEEDFTPPAPFNFLPEKGEYWVEYGEDLDLRVNVKGSKLPTELTAVLNGQLYRLAQKEGVWFLSLENITQNYSLQYEAMGYRSETIEIRTFKSPRIGALDLLVNPPAYTGLKPKLISYSQNIKVLRGSDISFRFELENTENALLVSENDSLAIVEGWVSFRLDKSLNYGIVLSNEFENRLFFKNSKLEPVSDKSPEIEATYRFMDEDSTRIVVQVRARDDFGLSSLTRQERINDEEISTSISMDSYSFYEEIIDLKQYANGESYSLYYEVADNNTLYGPSRSRSETFNLRLLSKEERKAKQSKSEASLMESFEVIKLSREELNESLNNLENTKSKKQDWREEEKLKDLLRDLEEKQSANEKRRKQLEKLVEKELDKKKELKEQLKTLSDTEKQIEQLRKEIEDLLSKNEKEELKEKLQQLKQENKEQLRREERLEDLLKDLLFQRDMLQTIEDYKELSESLKEDADNTDKGLEDSKKMAESLEEKLKELSEDSKELSDLLEKEDFKKESESLKENLDKAGEAQEQNNSSDSKESKDKASENAGEMSKSLSAMMEGMQAKALEMNMKALRRILENLERYSLDIEAYKESVGSLDKGDPAFRSLLRKGSVLSANSKVINDSLIALSEKAPEIKDKVFKELNEMQGQLKSAQGHLQEVELMKAASAGQFSMMSANELALLLDASMQNMMSMMASKKKGKQNCEKPGGGKPKPGSMSEKLGKMGKMMEKLEKGSKPGSKGQGVNGKSLGQVLSEQESLREALKEMDKEGGENNGEAKSLEKELDEMEDLLLDRKFSEYIERFKRVESRLLESEKANMERKKKDERESKSSLDLEMRNGDLSQKQKESELKQNDILRLSPLLMNPFYQK